MRTGLGIIAGSTILAIILYIKKGVKVGPCSQELEDRINGGGKS